MKYLYCWAVSLLICTSASAQWRFGPLAGFNVSNYIQTLKDKKQQNEVKLGGRLGLLVEKQLADHLFFQPGLNYVTNGYKHESGLADRVYMVNTLELPANLEYKLGDSCSNHWFFGGGPYAAWNFGGRLNLKSGSTIYSHRDLYIGPAISDDIKRFDVGFGLNGGYEFNKAILIRVHFQMGFLNLEPVGNDANKMRNYNTGFSVAFLFPEKNREKHRTRNYDDEIKPGKKI